jgi:hypothetical protein
MRAICGLLSYGDPWGPDIIQCPGHHVDSSPSYNIIFTRIMPRRKVRRMYTQAYPIQEYCRSVFPLKASFDRVDRGNKFVHPPMSSLEDSDAADFFAITVPTPRRLMPPWRTTPRLDVNLERHTLGDGGRSSTTWSAAVSVGGDSDDEKTSLRAAPVELGSDQRPESRRI